MTASSSSTSSSSYPVVSPDEALAELLRGLAPQVLAVLARRYARFDAAEDAVQEALLAASLQWPAEGVPANPRAWLVTVATRRLTDELTRRQEHFASAGFGDLSEQRRTAARGERLPYIVVLVDRTLVGQRLNRPLAQIGAVSKPVDFLFFLGSLRQTIVDLV